MSRSNTVTSCLKVGLGPVEGAANPGPAWHYQMQPGAAYLCVGTEGWDGPFAISEVVALEAKDSHELSRINGNTVAIFDYEDGRGLRRYAQPIPMQPRAANEARANERHKVERIVEFNPGVRVESHRNVRGVAGPPVSGAHKNSTALAAGLTPPSGVPNCMKSAIEVGAEITKDADSESPEIESPTVSGQAVVPPPLKPHRVLCLDLPSYALLALLTYWVFTFPASWIEYAMGWESDLQASISDASEVIRDVSERIGAIDRQLSELQSRLPSGDTFRQLADLADKRAEEQEILENLKSDLDSLSRRANPPNWWAKGRALPAVVSLLYVAFLWGDARRGRRHKAATQV